MKEYKIKEFPSHTLEGLIRTKMKNYDPEIFTDDDMTLFFSKPSTMICVTYGNKMVAFGTVLNFNDQYFSGYSWNNSTYMGRKGYMKGIRYINKTYKGINYVPYKDLKVEKFKTLK